MPAPSDPSKSREAASHLFLVRVWQENYAVNAADVRYYVKHVLSGEGRLFRDGKTFLQYLEMKVIEAEKRDEPT